MFGDSFHVFSAVKAVLKKCEWNVRRGIPLEEKFLSEFLRSEEDKKRRIRREEEEKDKRRRRER